MKGSTKIVCAFGIYRIEKEEENTSDKGWQQPKKEKMPNTQIIEIRVDLRSPSNARSTRTNTWEVRIEFRREWVGIMGVGANEDNNNQHWIQSAAKKKLPNSMLKWMKRIYYARTFTDIWYRLLAITSGGGCSVDDK